MRRGALAASGHLCDAIFAGEQWEPDLAGPAGLRAGQRWDTKASR